MPGQGLCQLAPAARQETAAGCRAATNAAGGAGAGSVEEQASYGHGRGLAASRRATSSNSTSSGAASSPATGRAISRTGDASATCRDPESLRPDAPAGVHPSDAGAAITRLDIAGHAGVAGHVQRGRRLLVPAYARRVAAGGHPPARADTGCAAHRACGERTARFERSAAVVRPGGEPAIVVSSRRRQRFIPAAGTSWRSSPSWRGSPRPGPRPAPSPAAPGRWLYRQAPAPRGRARRWT